MRYLMPHENIMGRTCDFMLQRSLTTALAYERKNLLKLERLQGPLLMHVLHWSWLISTYFALLLREDLKNLTGAVTCSNCNMREEMHMLSIRYVSLYTP